MMEDARALFDRMPMEMKDLITMNAMVEGFAKECRCEEVLKLFRELELAKIKPNNFTLVSNEHAHCVFSSRGFGSREADPWLYR